MQKQSNDLEIILPLTTTYMQYWQTQTLYYAELFLAPMLMLKRKQKKQFLLL